MIVLLSNGSLSKEATSNSGQNSLLDSSSFTFYKSDLNRVNKILFDVKASDATLSLCMFDTYGYSLSIDEKIYIDVYGQNDKIDSILSVIFKHRKAFSVRGMRFEQI
jgi:hypothetical protein